MPSHATSHPDSNRLMPDSQAMLDGPARSALRQAVDALGVAEQRRMPIEMCLALAQVARCYRALQALEPTEWYLEQAYRWSCLLGAADQSVELLCLLAEVSCTIAQTQHPANPRRKQQALERTRDRAFEAGALAEKVADAEWEIKVLLRISDVLDRCGDHDDAVQLQARAMRLIYDHSLATAAHGVAIDH